MIMNDCFQFGWGWGWPFGWLIWFAFIILVVLFIVRLTRGPVSHPPREAGHDSAMTILKERYARGEISREEYMERKKTLEES